MRLIPFEDGRSLPLEELTGILKEIFKLEVLVTMSETLPEDAYTPYRNQWKAERILENICRSCIRTEEICLGITRQDCYADGLNFVFGLARSLPPCALVATARLEPSFYGASDDSGLFVRRLATEAVHEIGHTLGLGHCPDPHCVMHFSNTLADTDRKGYRFCPRCYSALEVLLKPCRE